MNLPDINVWVSLVHEAHPHHAISREWIEKVLPKEPVYFCRITQLGMLRVLSGVWAKGVEPLTQVEAWEQYDLFMGDPRITIIDEPPGLERLFRRISSRNEITPKLWTDDYLMAFAEEANLRLITFDQALAARAPSSILLTP